MSRVWCIWWEEVYKWEIRKLVSFQDCSSLCNLGEIPLPLWTFLCLSVQQWCWMTPGVFTLFPVKTLGFTKFLRDPSGWSWIEPSRLWSLPPFQREKFWFSCLTLDFQKRVCLKKIITALVKKLNISMSVLQGLQNPSLLPYSRISGGSEKWWLSPPHCLGRGFVLLPWSDQFARSQGWLSISKTAQV